MDIITSVFTVAFEENINSIGHNQIFSWGGASFLCHDARTPRGGLPRDSKDFRVLVEFPPEGGEAGWELEVLIATRNGAVWNPAARLTTGKGYADDTDDQVVILARVMEWAMSL